MIDNTVKEEPVLLNRWVLSRSSAQAVVSSAGPAKEGRPLALLLLCIHGEYERRARLCREAKRGFQLLKPVQGHQAGLIADNRARAVDGRRCPGIIW